MRHAEYGEGTVRQIMRTGGRRLMSDTGIDDSVFGVEYDQVFSRNGFSSFPLFLLA